jgi:hypothetical protein
LSNRLESVESALWSGLTKWTGFLVVWSSSPLPVIVTMARRLIFANGLVLLLVTPETLARLLERMQYGQHYSLNLLPVLIIDLYLTCAGFAASNSRPRSA